jgi:hypothetical protein
MKWAETETQTVSGGGFFFLTFPAREFKMVQCEFDKASEISDAFIVLTERYCNGEFLILS